MEPKHQRVRSTQASHRRDSLAAFLSAHLGQVESDDVGPIIGQAAFVSEVGSRAATMHSVDRAGVSAALSGMAPTVPMRGSVGQPNSRKAGRPR